MLAELPISLVSTKEDCKLAVNQFSIRLKETKQIVWGRKTPRRIGNFFMARLVDAIYFVSPRQSRPFG